ncbi:MAG: ABC transporter permease, partial [Chloroflexi bacterium]|nr:ABC transporter permease [Chloroflexota bacterium]
MSEAPSRPPRWVGIALIPLVNLMLALGIAGLIVLAIGENPLTALRFLLFGAFGYIEGLG